MGHFKCRKCHQHSPKNLQWNTGQYIFIIKYTPNLKCYMFFPFKFTSLVNKNRLGNHACTTYTCLSSPLRTFTTQSLLLPAGKERDLRVKWFYFGLRKNIWTTTKKLDILFGCHKWSKFNVVLSVQFAKVCNIFCSAVHIWNKGMSVHSLVIMKFARLRPTKSAHFNSLGESQKLPTCTDKSRRTCLSSLLRTFVCYVPLQKFNISTKHGKRRHSDSSHQKEEMKLVRLE